jgi:YVTN family beta-propeller protein
VQAAGVLRQALAVWRGAPLADFAYEPFAQPGIAQLEELHLAATEERVDADLALGRARELVGGLRDLVERHPLRERLRGQLMLALYRCGRQAEALHTYQEFRQVLSDELGLEPGPGLRQLELAILSREPTLDLPPTAGPPVPIPVNQPRPREARVWDRRGRAVLVAGSLLLALVLVGFVGTTPSGIAVGAGGVWVTNNYSRSVLRIDPAVNRVVQTIPVGNAPDGVAVGYGSVWVANSSDGTLTPFDAITGDVIRTITLGGAGATDVTVGGGAVWVSDEAGDRVTRVDPQADQVTATIDVGSGPTAISFGFGSVWVTNSLDGTISRIDPGTDAVDGTIEVGNGGGGIAIARSAVWVASQYASTVSRIDPATDAVELRSWSATGLSGRSDGGLNARGGHRTERPQATKVLRTPAGWLAGGLIAARAYVGRDGGRAPPSTNDCPTDRTYRRESREALAHAQQYRRPGRRRGAGIDERRVSERRDRTLHVPNARADVFMQLELASVPPC